MQSVVGNASEINTRKRVMTYAFDARLALLAKNSPSDCFTNAQTFLRFDFYNSKRKNESTPKDEFVFGPSDRRLCVGVVLTAPSGAQNNPPYSRLRGSKTLSRVFARFDAPALQVRLLCALQIKIKTPQP